MKNLFLTLICLFALSFPALAQIEGYVEENVNNDAYVVPADEAVRQKLDQWQDLKFGVLFHWGIYATTGVIESWSLVSQDIDWQYKARVAAGMDYDTYKKWYFSLKDVFNPIHFDPQQWADVMEDAGIRYMLFTTKHHDGFCMYDSKLTDFSITHGAFRNNPQSDVYKHVLDAFRDKNMMVGAYFSKPDWHCQWFWNPLFSTGQSMHQNYDISKHPDWWRNFCDYACGQIDEITGNYGPIDIVWLDGGLRCEAIGIDKAIEAARERTPGLICVDRSQHGPYENYRTPEREIPAEKLDYPWESCIPLSHWWTYKTFPDVKFKPAREVVNMLSEIVAKGGCLALGIGPTDRGLIQPEVVAILQEVGKWMRANGEAIYCTRPTERYNDGNTWFTASKDGETLYAIHTLDEGEALPQTITWHGNVPCGKMTLLATGKSVKYKVDGDEVIVTLPKGMPADSFALKFNVEK